MILESADIKFACPQCGQRIVVDKSAAGVESHCPICEGPLTVPAASSIAETRSGNLGVESGRGNFADPGLEDAREELFSSSVELGRMQRELDEANEEVERMRALFKKAVDECERITASATHAQAEIKSFHIDRQQLKSDLSVAKQRALMAENQVSELAASLAAATHESTALRQQIEQESALGEERFGATQAQLDLRERQLAATQAENSEIVQSLAAGQSELATLRAELGGLRQELTSAQELLNEAADNEERIVAAKHELEAKLDQSTGEGRALRHELDDLREQARTLQQDLGKTDVGAELLELRGSLRDLTDDRARIADTLAEKRAELKDLTDTEQALRGDLEESRRLREEAEQKAAANSELQLNKDNDVLRGIVARQNTTLGVYYSEVRRMRRGRYGLRIVYGLFALGLLGLIFFAITVFTHRGGAGQLSDLLH